MSQVVCNASQGVVTRFLRCSTWNLNGLAAVSFQFAICGPDVYFHLRRVFHVEPRIFAFKRSALIRPDASCRVAALFGVTWNIAGVEVIGPITSGQTRDSFTFPMEPAISNATVSKLA